MNDNSGILFFALSLIVILNIVDAIHSCSKDSTAEKVCDPYQVEGHTGDYAICKTPEGPIVKEIK